jgi:cytochrome P450
MPIEARTASLWDNLRLQLFVTLPGALWGLVAPNRLGVWLLCRLNSGRATYRFLSALRRKYGCEHLWVWFPLGRTLLVLDPDSADAVLRSEDNAADPLLKKRALSGLVPDALVISSGREWAERRRFNEALLDSGKGHRHREAFAEIVFREVERLVASQSGRLLWSDFQALGERIAHQVILGPGAVEPQSTADLAAMTRRSNWLVLPRLRRAFSAFYGRVERHLSEPPPAACLMHDSARELREGRTTASTRVPAQIGFWFFVLKDALELHVARTLALIAAHQDVQLRARQEARGAAAMNAGTVENCRYLEACIEEQLRLWTPVPILLRRATSAFALRDAIPIREGDQLLFHAGFHHRDARLFGEAADRFLPGAKAGAAPAVFFFSRHRQSCAGEALARFLLKAVLAALLARCRFELDAPAIAPERIDALYDHFRIELRMTPA